VKNRLEKDLITEGSTIRDTVRPLAEAMFERWSANVTKYRQSNGLIIDEIRLLAASFAFSVFLGKNEIDPADVVLWQEEYEHYSTSVWGVPIPLEGLPYARACGRFRRIAEGVRTSKWFRRRLFREGLADTGPEYESEVATYPT